MSDIRPASHSCRLCAMSAKVAMEVLALSSEESPCVDCGLITGRFCEGCFARDRDFKEVWVDGQPIALWSECNWMHGGCHYCRGLPWATPLAHE